MNPFFWLVVLLGLVAAWFGLRGLFVDIGARAAGLLQETKEILDSDEAVEENCDENGGNENA